MTYQKPFLFIVTALITLWTVSSRAQMDHYHSYNFIYKYDARSFYDQREVIALPSYQQANLKEQRDLLEANFNQKRRMAYIRAMTSSIIPASTSLVTITAAVVMRARLAQLAERYQAMGALIALVWHEPLGQFGSSLFRSLANGWIAYTKLSNTATNDPLEHLEIEYVRNKPAIAPELYEMIETNFIQARTHSFFSEEEGLRLMSLIHKIEIALALPRKLKKITYNAELIDNTLVGYQEDVLANIKRFCIRHMAASTSQSVRKIGAYFYGPPGVGKTRAAHLIADTLTIPISTISLADKPSAALRGNAHEPGLLLEALTMHNNKNAKNMIIVIDDASHVFDEQADPFILSLLEPETKTFYSPFLEAEIDISHIAFIIVSNDSLTNKALANRLHIVKFDGYGTHYKKDAIWQTIFPEMLNTHENSQLPLGMSDFSDADMRFINSLIEGDRDPGFRTIKLQLTNLIEDKVLEKHFGKKSYAETSVHDEEDDTPVAESSSDVPPSIDGTSHTGAENQPVPATTSDHSNESRIAH